MSIAVRGGLSSSRLHLLPALRYARQRGAIAGSSSDLDSVAPGNKVVSFAEMRWGNPLQLPRLPVPALEDSMASYIESLEPLARRRPEALAQAKKTAADFLRGDGALLQSMIIKKDASRKGEPYNYVGELWEGIHLGNRKSLALNANGAIGLQKPPDGVGAPAGSDPQIFGATKFISSFLKWHRRVHDGTFEPDVPPVCMHGYAFQAGVTQIPGRRRDEMRFYPESRHAVIFCNNCTFRLELLGTGKEAHAQIREADLQKALEDIRAFAFAKPPGRLVDSAFIGHLTSKTRTEWTILREELEDLSPRNRASLTEIDSALLTVALEDHDTPDDKSEINSLVEGHYGRNRWFDKHQLVVERNGSIGMNFNHSVSDGTAWTRMLDEVWRDMYGIESERIKSFPEAPLLSSPPGPPRELAWDLSDHLKEEVQKASQEFRRECGPNSIDILTFNDFGKAACKRWGLSPDGIVQMAIQLAYRRMHGELTSTWESCSTGSFFRGRTETIRSCTTEAADFTEVMDAESKSNTSRFAALERGIVKHVSLTKAARQAMGIDRHLFALRTEANVEAEAKGSRDKLGAMFFDDPMFTESSRWTISTSNMSFGRHTRLPGQVREGFSSGGALTWKLTLGPEGFVETKPSVKNCIKLARGAG